MRLTCARFVLPRLILAAVLPVALLLAGCASRPASNDPDAVADYQERNDPLEPTNRVFYAINNGIDTVLLRPAAIAYRSVVPGFVRRPVHNVLSNMSNPVRLADDVLQGKPRRAGDTFMRFLINSTVGVGGLFDVAADWGYPEHQTDFGVTLALWGLPEGPFLFLPILGPSNPRDVAGFGVDTVMDPFFWPPNGTGFNTLRVSRLGLATLDTRERLLDDVDQIKKGSLDPYATFRSLYRQHRASDVEATRNDNRATVPAWFLNR